MILLLWNTVSCQPFVMLDPSKIFGYSLGGGFLVTCISCRGFRCLCCSYLWVTKMLTI